jgi:ATP-binding cassette subfamily C exporter for protease/lipase
MKQLFDTRHELGRALSSFRKAFGQVALYSFVLNVLYLLPSIYMLQIYDRVLSSRNETTLLMLTLIALALYALFGVMEWIRTGMLIRIGARLDQNLNQRVFSAAMERHIARQGGNPAQALQDLTTTRQFVAGAGAVAFFDAPWAPIYLVVISMIHPWLGFASLVAVLILLVLTWLNEILTHKPLTEANQESLQALAFANNNLRNAEVIAALGMAPALQSRWRQRQDKVLALQVLASERGGGIGALGKALRIAFQSGILGFGALLVLSDAITPGGMIAASILMGRALAPVEQVIIAWKQWVTASGAYARLNELLQHYPAPPPSIHLPAPVGEIALEEVSAVPPGARVAVLRNLSLRMRPGDVVGIVGPSGAGKSSLARLLVGIWSPSSGHVRLDGADVHAWPREDLGPYIGYLPQDIGLFEGTVAENIARFGPLDDAKIVTAARLAGVHDLVLHLPQGYETPVGVDGGALSGGQRQRIALARTLYGDPTLLVLDEPNSNLDEVGEAALVAAIAQAKARGATVIFVSHSARLIGVADKLLALREGQLNAYGPRDQVLTFLQQGQHISKAPQIAQREEA